MSWREWVSAISIVIMVATVGWIIYSTPIVRPGQTFTITIPQCAPILGDETGIGEIHFDTKPIFPVESGTGRRILAPPDGNDPQFDPIPYQVPKAPQPDIPGRKEA